MVSDKLKKIGEIFWSGHSGLEPETLRPSQTGYLLEVLPFQSRS